MGTSFYQACRKDVITMTQQKLRILNSFTIVILYIIKNQILGVKIKKLRISKDLSQQKLAELSGLSLRTIQRIEKDQVKPTSDTISRLSEALNINITEVFSELSNTNIKSLKLVYLSSLTFLIFPILSFLSPAIICIWKKNKLKGNEKTLKSLIYFQVSWCIGLFIFPFILNPFLDLLITLAYPITNSFLNSNINLPSFSREFIIFSWTLLYIFNLYIILKKTWKLDRKDNLNITTQTVV